MCVCCALSNAVLTLITPGIIVIKITRYTFIRPHKFFISLYNLPQIFPRVARLKKLFRVLSCFFACIYKIRILHRLVTCFFSNSPIHYSICLVLLVILPLSPAILLCFISFLSHVLIYFTIEIYVQLSTAKI